MKQILLKFGFFLILSSILSTKSMAYEVLTLEQFDLEKYRGQFVYLDFWASWCVPCAKSFPWMTQLDMQYSDDKLAIVAVGIDKTPKNFDKFLEKFDATFTVVRDTKATLAQQFDLQGMPNSFLINPKGEIVFRHIGFRKKDIAKLERELQSLITP